MNIKQIADRIIKESQVNAADYPIADRIDDINSEYLQRVEKAVQIGSTQPLSAGEATSEEFTVVAGSNVFTRTIQDVPIFRVDFKHANSTIFEPICSDPGRLIGGFNIGQTRYFGNEKQMFVEEGHAGTLRTTYARGGVTLFTVADYNLGSGWPSPDHLPVIFQDFLWLYPSYNKTRVKELRQSLEGRIEKLEPLFVNRYGRESSHDAVFVTEYDNDPGGHR